jgi:phage-related holin
MSYVQMLYKPLLAMYHNFALILPASLVAVGISILQTLYDLVQVEQTLVVGLVCMMILDLISGLYKANTNKKVITSIGLRQTTIKFIEYTMALLGFVIVANMSGLEWIKTTSFVWLSLIELKSIAENLSDKNGIINELFNIIKNRFKDDNK